MHVPFVDLKTPFASLGPEIMHGFESVCRRAAFILGPEVTAFEEDFAAYCSCSEAVGVASGCDALLWGLKACGVGAGDEVITVANTYIATALAITCVGARPVLVDCLPETYLMDPEQVRAAITPKTKAIIPVHLYGQAADMEALQALADEHGLVLIEDAAQAHGSTRNGKACGSMGAVGCFSFYPGKNLGAYGDGGAVTTSDVERADYIRQARNYGQSKKYYHDQIGWNSRLDTLQAVVLHAKLKRLDAATDLRRSRAARYREQLADAPLELPTEVAGNKHVYHLFVVRHPRRDELMAFLQERDIHCGIHYPVPIHLQQAYASLGQGSGSFPVTEAAAAEIFSLPMFPELSDAQVDYVCSSIHEFFATAL